jgi:hypothetical protein
MNGRDPGAGTSVTLTEPAPPSILRLGGGSLIGTSSGERGGTRGPVTGSAKGVDLLQRLHREGVLLQSAHGPVPNVAELVAGEAIRGSWWGHPKSHEIFRELNKLRRSPEVVATRLINGKVTLIHRRLWPALARLAHRYPPRALAALHEEHTQSGAHRVTEVPFPEWVPAADREVAGKLTEQQADEQLPAFLRR